MPIQVARFPFVRTVKLDPDKVPGFRCYATVLDHLRVELPAYKASVPGFVAVETGEAGTRSVRLAVGRKSYEGYLREWSGLPVDDAVLAVERDLRARHTLSHDFPDDAVLDDGRTRQEAERADFEANAVVVDGRAYGRDPVPEVCLVLRNDAVAVRTLRAGEPRPDAWMRFPLDRRDEALEMARTLAAGIPGIRGREGAMRVDTVEFTRWTVKDPDGLAALPLSEGGHGGRFERVWAFAEDFLRLVTPSVGHFPNTVVEAFADTRAKAAMGDDADESLDALARGILDAAPATSLDPATLARLRVAAQCLIARMEDHEPRYGAARTM